MTYSSAQVNSQAYLRFNNAGMTAGIVAVTLLDQAIDNILVQWTSPSIAPVQRRKFSITSIERAATQSFTKPLLYSATIQPSFIGSFQ